MSDRQRLIAALSLALVKLIDEERDHQALEVEGEEVPTDVAAEAA